MITPVETEDRRGPAYRTDTLAEEKIDRMAMTNTGVEK